MSDISEIRQTKGIKFMPVNTEATARNVSQAIHRLTRPGVISDEDKSQYSCQWFQHNGNWFLIFDLDLELPIHAERAPDFEYGVLSFVQEGSLSQDSANDILSYVNQNIGKVIYLDDVIPDEWRPYMLDSLE